MEGGGNGRGFIALVCPRGRQASVLSRSTVKSFRRCPFDVLSKPRPVARRPPFLIGPQRMEQVLPATEITALLGRGTQFEGKLHFEGRVRIDGVFKGEILSDDTLVIGEGAEGHAEIDVATVVVRGGVGQGNSRAETAAQPHPPGKSAGY